MKIQGKIFSLIGDEKTPLPYAHVVRSDASGNPLSPMKGTTSGIDGGYTLDNIGFNDHVTFSFTGFQRVVHPANAASGDIFLSPVELPGFTVFGDLSDHKPLLVLLGVSAFLVGGYYAIIKPILTKPSPSKRAK